MRGAFYYPWYPEQWTKAGHRYDSSLGTYSSDDPKVITAHINQLKYAKVDVGIYSWWGKGTPTDTRFQAYLDEAQRLGFKFCVYYEQDWKGQASWLFRVKPDLNYLKKYFSHPAYLKIDGKPVVYVYNPESNVKNAAKWAKARSEFGLYVSLADYPQWWTAMNVDSWHPYRPAARHYAVGVGNRNISVSLSAGFWGAGEDTPRLLRNFSEWMSAVASANEVNPEWQLVYFNEFGEGSNIEPSTARCEEFLCSDYLKVLAG